MTFQLPPLPYALDSLQPYISKETLEYHYGKHHQAYINKLNTLVQDTPFAEQTLEEIIMRSSGGIFNNAAQVWNHTFYWHCMTPSPSQKEPEGALGLAIQEAFGSFAAFKEKFTAAALNQFGSGWAWLAKNPDGSLEVYNTSNAGTPMIDHKTALLTCDVWEHAYYIDTRNDRPKYVDHFWEVVNWDFVGKNL